MISRAILTEADIRKIALGTRPATVEELISMIKDTLNLASHSKEPDFNNKLCNLSMIEDHPGKATVKIHPMLEVEPDIYWCHKKHTQHSGYSHLITLTWTTHTQRPELSGIPAFLADVETWASRSAVSQRWNALKSIERQKTWDYWGKTIIKQSTCSSKQTNPVSKS